MTYGKNYFNIRMMAAVMFMLLLLSCFTPPVTVAEESGYAKIREDYENTDVMGDLEGVDLTKYQGLKTVSVISFNEFGYMPGDMSGYGLYIYVYNDTGNQIVNYNLNRVQLSADGSSYNKYRVTILDNTDDFTVYKLRVEDAASIGSAVNAEERTYHISGIELITTTTGLTDYAVSSIYKYTGTPALEDGAESTLSCTVEQQDTVLITGLEDRQTVYRTDMDNPNMQSHNQINSVYFAVDNYFISTYGMLQSIEAEWWEYRTNPIVVTNNEEFYYAVTPFLHKDIGNHNCDLDFYLTQKAHPNPDDIEWVYNMNDEHENVICNSRLDWLLKTTTWGSNLENYVVENSLLEEFRFSYEQSQIASFSEKDHGYSYCTDLFNTEVGEGRTAGYNRKVFDSTDPNDMIDFKEYDPNYRGWDEFKNIFGWEDDFDEVLTDVSPIVLIDSSNSDYYLSGSNEEIANKMLIAEEDVANFKQYASNAVKNDETVVLFRFANTEYYAEEAFVAKYSDHTVHAFYTYKDYEESTFTAQQNVFLNFDIMTLGFYNGEKMSIIPVVSSPIDIISDVVGPKLPDLLPWDDPEWGLMDYIYFALMVVVAVLVFVVLYGILDMISNSVMRAPSSGNRNYNRRKRRR